MPNIKDEPTLGTMTLKHPRWAEFCELLEGPRGCNFRQDPLTSTNSKDTRWNCNRDRTLPKSRAILRSMGASEADVVNSVLYLHERGGHCDCEVLFNVHPLQQRPVRTRRRKLNSCFTWVKQRTDL